MWIDPIVEDLHTRRREHAAGFEFDVHRLFMELKKLDDGESAVQAELVTLTGKRLDSFRQAA